MMQQCAVLISVPPFAFSFPSLSLPAPNSYDSMLAQCKHQLQPHKCGSQFLAAAGLGYVSRVC